MVSDAARSPAPFQRTPARTPPSGKFLPRRGTFSVNPKKAAVYSDRSGKKFVTVPAASGRESARTLPGSTATSIADSSPRTSVAAPTAEESDFTSELSSQAMTSGPMSLMLTGMLNFGQANGTADGHAIGPPEAFYPMVDIATDGTWAVDNAYDSDLSMDGEDDDDLDVDAFMDLSQCADPNEEDETVAAVAAAAEELLGGTTEPSGDEQQQAQHPPAQRTRSTSASMLDHFDRVPVASFRSNQTLCRALSALPANPLDRKSVAQPVKKGKSAEALMSPVRRRGPTHERKRARPHGGFAPACRGPRIGTFS